MFLTACNSGKKEETNDFYTSLETNQNNGTALAKEKAYSTGSAFVKISGSIPEADISMIDSWICEDYPVEVYNLGTKSESGELDGNFLIAVIEIADADWRYLDMSSRFPALHEYTNEELSDYREECKEIFLNATKKNSSETSNNANGELEESSNNQEQSSESQNELANFECPFFDGQRFECFETTSGEDIILTIRVFSSDNGETSYKGELSNGVEFWFESFDSSDKYINYLITYSDGTNGYMNYVLGDSEIEMISDDDVKMSQYNGTYIGLPDEIEE